MSEDIDRPIEPRLSTRILHALNLSLDQGDIEVSEYLARALELAMTRMSGGGEFVERRDFPQEIEQALDKLTELKKNASE